ncbi:hypothetical protein HYPBUDRAFT_179759 [Hyphopichia burtonii NRRL Y-1933]|uniref:Uncharacterized protein n=1 Tax=Hyphopichia burtonii NRRL Y-1933 TaxID=984485 RepID=A0A1E4RSG2_9ASCO|nr:hypothetical protein HYPBUDRAFT_179759 [Hyphopichia burtonii NRRL Y-1933]ODV70220.1 hypothetical protein HYPBUDRAFT_179759 [Hyphopichia burtonii NRRL Y-1933]
MSRSYFYRPAPTCYCCCCCCYCYCCCCCCCSHQTLLWMVFGKRALLLGGVWVLVLVGSVHRITLY